MFYPSLYQDRGSNATYQAQRNLCERTHYVDDNTLRWHKARVLQCYITDGGLLFTILESVALDMDNTRRGFRYVTFDVCGNVVSRVDLEQCWSTREAARKAMWRYLNAIDAKAITRDALARCRAGFDAVVADLLTHTGMEG